MPTTTAKTAAKTPAKKKKPAAKKPAAAPAVDASFPAQRVDLDVNPDTGNAHLHIQGVFDSEAVKGLAKRINRLAIEVS